MGSRDRKTVSAMVYAYYRLGHNKFKKTEDRILAALRLTNELPEILAYFTSTASPEIKAYLVQQLQEFDEMGLFSSDSSPAKASDGSEDYSSIFPWTNLLSEGIDKAAFAKSFLIQPDLFLRIRPGRKKSVIKKLEEANISFKPEDEDCVVLRNASKIDTVLEINRDVVVQDINSQRTASLLNEFGPTSQTVRIWDCCAASGGKSIMMYDRFPSVELTASDNRITILRQLDERFREAGIKNYQSFVADLIKDNVVLPDKKYDLVIADVPCTGSGTWARTPEQLYFFREERVDHYHNLQQSIVSRIIPKVKETGLLLYITCSVFARENEEVVDFIVKKKGLTLLKKKLFTGYNEKADTLFAALFTNPPV